MPGRCSPAPVPFMMKTEAPLPGTPVDSTPFWLTAVRAAESKKAYNIRVLDLREVTSFTDFFVICTGANPRQIQTISEAIGEELAKRGEHPQSVEGFQNAEWVLTDYGDYIIHVFSASAREYYDLERLWRAAKEVEIPATEPSAK